MSDKLSQTEEKALRAEARETVMMKIAISAFVTAQTQAYEGKVFDEGYQDVHNSVTGEFESTFQELKKVKLEEKAAARSSTKSKDNQQQAKTQSQSTTNEAAKDDQTQPTIVLPSFNKPMPSAPVPKQGTNTTGGPKNSV